MLTVEMLVKQALQDPDGNVGGKLVLTDGREIVFRFQILRVDEEHHADPFEEPGIFKMSEQGEG